MTMHFVQQRTRVRGITIAGYHAGIGSLAKFGYTVPPYKFTRQYLKMVLERYYQYKDEEAKARAQ